ncbi:unnamed protein product [Paramecium sonneborni]|uniref:Transmembrane protein n=1 Tax=Paramecium sonneborni TaxID=65129 RepID=A0A8S1PNZ7_9CILI|nr:unnamed protein product [Paramecium sonneborni]
MPNAWGGQLNGTGCELRQKSIQENVNYCKILEFWKTIQKNSLQMIILSLFFLQIIDQQQSIKTIQKKKFQRFIQYEMNYIHQIILNDNILLVITETIVYIVYLLPLNVPVSVVEFAGWISRQEFYLFKSSIQNREYKTQFILIKQKMEILIMNMQLFKIVNICGIQFWYFFIKQYHKIQCKRYLIKKQ